MLSVLSSDDLFRLQEMLPSDVETKALTSKVKVTNSSHMRHTWYLFIFLSLYMELDQDEWGPDGIGRDV